MGNHGNLEQILEYLERDINLQENIYLYAEKRYKGRNLLTDKQQKRKKDFIDLMRNYSSENFTPEMTNKIVSGLEENFCISTAGHHWPIGHPFFFHATILRSLLGSTPVINFNISQVSLWNSSYPRGLLFHSDAVDNTHYLHVPLLWSNKRMSPVYGAPWFTTEDIEKNAIKRLKEYRNNDVISETNYYNIYTFLERNILNNSPLFEKKYSEQVTLLNYSWWNEIFDDSSRYVFELDAEAIISFIIQNFLSSQSGPLFEILCNTNIQGLIEKKFNNIDCCFSLEKNSGTYLFWHLDEDGKRWSMWRDSDELKSEDKSFTIPMIPDVLGQNLKDKKIIPSGMLIYTILVGYFWITCFGWIFQSKYLEKIINAYCDLFPEESEISQGLDISTICADMYFIFSSQNLPMTALDMVINKNNIQYRQEQTVLESIKNSFADL